MKNISITLSALAVTFNVYASNGVPGHATQEQIDIFKKITRESVNDFCAENMNEAFSMNFMPIHSLQSCLRKAQNIRFVDARALSICSNMTRPGTLSLVDAKLSCLERIGNKLFTFDDMNSCTDMLKVGDASDVRSCLDSSGYVAYLR